MAENMDQTPPTNNSINEPYLLSSSDHPGMSLTSSKFGGSNFLGWSRTVKMALGAKQKIGFIDGTCVKPAINSADYHKWIRCDYMVTCWILNSMESELSDAFLYAQSATELWQEISERFGHTTGPQIYQIQKELNDTNQGDLTVAAYFTKLKRSWDELSVLNGAFTCSCGKMSQCTCGLLEKFTDIENRTRLMQFLMKLNSEYESTRSQILSMDPLPNVNKAYYIVQQIETQKNVTKQNFEPAAFLVNNPGSQMQNVGRKEYRKGKGNDRKFCRYCNSEGHAFEQCFERIGYPDWYKGKRGKKTSRMGASVNVDVGYGTMLDNPLEVQDTYARTSSKSEVDSSLVSAVCQEVFKMLKGSHFAPEHTEASINFAGTTCNASFAMNCLPTYACKEHEWIVDTGASDHMTPYYHLLTNIKRLATPIKISLPDGSPKLVFSVGNVQLTKKLQLENVFYVPDFKHNLLSVGKLINAKSLVAHFLNDSCVFQDPSTDNIVAVGHGSGGLYTLKASPETILKLPNFKPRPLNSFFDESVAKKDTFLPVGSTNNVCNVDLHLLHNRLGHTSISKMHHLEQCQGVTSDKLFCEACIMSKIHRLPFPNSTHTSTKPFELVHIDLWGPYKRASVNGAHYFLTLVDDHTRSTWTYLVHTKDQVSSILISFLHYVSNHFQERPKFFRSDNGTEIVNQQCADIFQKMGIIHQRSMVHTPQQNGIVERKHRHLIETARAIKIHAGLPSYLWGECVLAATYLINKMPIAKHGWKSPYEVLFGTKPEYTHLRTIGCLCYAAITGPRKDKFAAKARKCVLIGYPPGQKGYKLLDLQTRTVFCSRDVIFCEEQFPFKDTPKSSVPPLPVFKPASIPIVPDTPSNTSLNESIPSLDQPPTDISTTPNNTTSHDTPTPPPSPPRRSQRTIKPPIWLKDYTCPKQVNHTSSSTQPLYPLTFLNDPASSSSDYTSFLANVLPIHEPSSYAQAKEHDGWVQAMEIEIMALEANDTWELTTLPKGHKAIDSKWVYKTKYHPDGTLDRLKARLVIKGYSQQEGTDYKHTFSPVAKLATVRVLIALAAANKWPLHQLDINNAFLHGYIDEEIYMKPPDGYFKAKPGQVCRLKRSLYGLKQASRQWNLEFTQFLVSLGYQQSKHDYSLFVKKEGSSFTIALVYVDDVLLTGNSIEEINATKNALHRKFTIKDLGLAKYFLGLEIFTSDHGTWLHQRKYILDLLTDCGLTAVKPAKTPLPQGLKLSLDTGETLSDAEPYRSLIGRLLYLSLTRPDISYSVQHLSQFVSQPTKVHMQAALHVLKYLKGSINKGLFYPVQQKLSLVGFSDSDWASCVMTRKSLTGYCIFLGHSLISWKTKKQNTVSRSSTEAEYRSMATTTCEILWLSYLLHDLHVPCPTPITLFCDNKAAQQIAANPCFHERTKHLDIDCHFTREKVQDGFLQTAYIPSSLQLADLMTKSLPAPQHCHLLSKLGFSEAPT